MADHADRRGRAFAWDSGSALAPALLGESAIMRPLRHAINRVAGLKVRRLGETGARRVDVRLLITTNRDLTADVLAGRFRGTFCIASVSRVWRAPALDSRREDIPLLADTFRREACLAHGHRVETISHEPCSTRRVLGPDFDVGTGSSAATSGHHVRGELVRKRPRRSWTACSKTAHLG